MLSKAKEKFDNLCRSAGKSGIFWPQNNPRKQMAEEKEQKGPRRAEGRRRSDELLVKER